MQTLSVVIITFNEEQKIGQCLDSVKDVADEIIVVDSRSTDATEAICDRYETTLLVSGLPLNMDGTEGFQAKKVRALCEQLTRSGLSVSYQDERLSTVTAEEALLEGNVSRDERRGKVDKVAAAVILEQWLKENT